MTKRQRDELRGAAKLLDGLWNNSYYSMGEKAADRLENEMIYLFGNKWTKKMYDLIEENNDILIKLDNK